MQDTYRLPVNLFDEGDDHWTDGCPVLFYAEGLAGAWRAQIERKEPLSLPPRSCQDNSGIGQTVGMMPFNICHAAGQGLTMTDSVGHWLTSSP